MRKPFVLIQDELSHDTVQCLETLLSHAKRGEVIGVAIAAALKRRGYITNTAGECHRNPTWARGLVAALDDQLSSRIRGGSD